jgi:hypothetical protein
MARPHRRPQRTRSNRPTAPRQQPALRVSYAEAQRVRTLLLSSEAETLSKRDVAAILTIIDDVYPSRPPASRTIRWHPLLVGIGIGLVLVIGIALFW